MVTKDLDLLSKNVDVLQDRVTRIEEQLSKIQIYDVIIKGREILNIYSKLKTIGVLDIYKIHEDVERMKETLTRIEFHPWEWLERDPVARKAFISRLEKRIADEVRQSTLFTIYQENPQIVVKIVKDAVREYLNIWEVNPQIAKQLVSNVLKDGYLMEIVRHLTTIILSPEYRRQLFQNVIDMKKLQRVKNMLEKEG